MEQSFNQDVLRDLFLAGALLHGLQLLLQLHLLSFYLLVFSSEIEKTIVFRVLVLEFVVGSMLRAYFALEDGVDAFMKQVTSQLLNRVEAVANASSVRTMVLLSQHAIFFYMLNEFRMRVLNLSQIVALYIFCLRQAISA